MREHPIPGDGIHDAQVTTQDDRLGVQRVDQVDQAHAQPIGDAGECRDHFGIATFGTVDERAKASGRGCARGASERGESDLGLPASACTAAAGVALRVDAHVADLAAVATRAHEGASVDEDSATHTDIAREIDHGAAVTRTAAHLLSEHAEVGVIAHRHVPPSAAESVAQELPEGHIGPAEVGRDAHETVCRAHDAGHARAYTDERCAGRERFDDLTTDLDYLVQHGVTITRPVTAFRAREDLTAQSDQRGDGALNAQVQRQDRHRCGDRLHDKGRSTHAADIPCTLAHETERSESAHEVTYRAAIEPGDRCEM